MRNPDGSVCLQKAWPSAKARQHFADELLDSGIPYLDVSVWLSAQPQFDDVVSQTACVSEWTQYFAAEAAQEWYESLAAPEDAYKWARAGYSPGQARETQFWILMSLGSGSVPAMLHREDHWRKSGLPPAAVIRALRAGITDPDPTVAVEAYNRKLDAES